MVSGQIRPLGVGLLIAIPVQNTGCGPFCGEKLQSPAREQWEGKLGTLVAEVSSVKNGVIDRKQTDSCQGMGFGGWEDGGIDQRTKKKETLLCAMGACCSVRKMFC